jgi:uncharacterized SAM-binding protein YcdF (DUF218 family)
MKRRSSLGQRILARVLSGLAVLWVISIIAVLFYGRRQEVEKGDAIVVLGAAQYSGRPSPVLQSRLDHAIALWKHGYAPLLVLTGGSGKGDATTEADVGRKYAMRKGVPDNDIVVENQGRSTIESLRTVAAMLKARNVKRTILVSDPFHMFRLTILAKRFGLEPHRAPTATSPISASRSRSLQYVLSESVKAPLAFIMER